MGLRRRVVAEGLCEVRLVGEDGLGVFLRGRLGLGLGLTALAVLLRLRVLLFLTLLGDPRPAATRRAQEKRQVNAVHARPLALLAVALAVEVSPLLLGRLLLGRLGGRDLCNSFVGDDAARDDVARVDGVQDDAVKFDLRTVFDVCAGHFCHVLSRRGLFGQSELVAGVSEMLAQASLVRLEKSAARERFESRLSKNRPMPLALRAPSL